jgi:hypothetical protein
MSGIVAGGGRRYRLVVSAEARAQAELEVAPLPAGAGVLRRRGHRLTVWLHARRLEKGERPSWHSLY